jgi:hypothetical protein
MDKSALLSALKSLETSWSSLDRWMAFWTFLVVVGVVAEIFVVVREWRHEVHEFRRGIIHSPDKPRVFMLVLGLLGASLVAVGVAGEFVVHLMAGKVETKMRDTTDTLVALIDEKAKAAGERAESLKTENLKLQALIQPRSLSLEQQRDIGAALLPFKGRKVVISWDPTGTEPYFFARQLEASLKVAELDVEKRLPATNGRWYPVYLSGVQVSWPPGQKDLGEKLGWALNNIGHVRDLRVSPEGEPSQAVTEPVYITVWSKPLDILP